MTLTNVDILNAKRDEIADILTECYRSHKVFAQAIFPEVFHRNFSSRIHDPIFELLDDSSEKRVVVSAPRGIGKTSIMNGLVPARGILFRDRQYIVPISCSATKAVQESENLKLELMDNPQVRALFGDMKSRVFSKEHWVADNGDISKGVYPTGVMPRGAGQQVRGLKYRRFRPDLIPVDDLEDPDEMDNPDTRIKKIKWFYADVMNSVDPPGDWRVLVSGTVLHEDSLVVRLVEDSRWASVELSICSNQFVSNWPEFKSDEDLVEDIAEARRQGTVDVFYREMMGQAVSEESRGFKPNMFKHYNEHGDEFKSRLSHIENVVILDPAKTIHITSADSAIVGVGFDTQENLIYFRDCVVGKMHPDEQQDEVFAMAKRLGARVIGLEVTSLNEYITWPFRTEMRRLGLHYEIVELKPRGGSSGRAGVESKAERVGSLLQFYRKGLVRHNDDVRIHGPLEAQLLQYPKAKKWDVMDAFAYIVQMLEMGMRYFTPTTGKEDDFKTVQAEYALLEEISGDMGPLPERWRIA